MIVTSTRQWKDVVMASYLALLPWLVEIVAVVTRRRGVVVVLRPGTRSSIRRYPSTIGQRRRPGTPAEVRRGGGAPA